MAQLLDYDCQQLREFLNNSSTKFVTSDFIDCLGSSIFYKLKNKIQYDAEEKKAILERVKMLHEDFGFTMKANYVPYDDPELLTFLIEYCGLEVNDKLFIGMCELGFSKNVKLLLDYGVKPNTDNGRLLCTSTREITKLLLEYGADVNINNGAALMYATHYLDYEVIQLLIEYGADTSCYSHPSNRVDKCITEPFHKTYDILVSNGIDPMTITELCFYQLKRLK